MLNWSEPVGVGEADWALACAPLYEQAIELAEPWRDGDRLAEQGWQEAVAVLDTRPEPTTPAAANARWRSFVLSLWQLRDQVMRRRHRMHQALAVRQIKRGHGAT